MHSAFLSNQRTGSSQGRRCDPPSQQKLKGGLDGLGRQLRAGSWWDYARISGVWHLFKKIIILFVLFTIVVLLLVVIFLSFVSRRKLYQRSWHAIRIWSGLGIVMKISLKFPFWDCSEQTTQMRISRCMKYYAFGFFIKSLTIGYYKKFITPRL